MTNPLLSNERTVDIIIPVYRGYEETLTCVNRLLASKAVNKTTMNIIVINDASPEPELVEALEGYLPLKVLTLLHNEENRGFVATVNRGMSQTDNDVVLLNSDTEVTGDWLDRLVTHLQDSQYLGGIASITPFSNNATICSYPVFCAQNSLPAGETLAHIDKLAQQANKGQSLELPTAVGFCMYIPRNALVQLGLFDEETFGRGYGEENDFCARAIKAGMHNIMALDVFVKHEGGVSFAHEQTPLQEKATQALLKKHPEYQGWVMDHVFHNPALLPRIRMDLLRFSQSDLPLIVCLLHAHGGGTQKHVEDLANALYGYANVLAVQPTDKGEWWLYAPIKSEAFELHFKRSNKAELVKLLSLLNITRLHYHHLLGLDADLIHLGQTLGLPYDFTAHDFFVIDKNIHIKGDQVTVDEQQVKRFSDFLAGASRRFVPSIAVKESLQMAYPQMSFTAVAHPDTITDSLPRPVIPQITQQPIQVLLIGAMGPEKGADCLEKAANYVRHHGLPIQFHLLGYTYQKLKTSANLAVYGAYEQKDLATLIGQIKPHWIWFPAQTPETYSYTLSAAMASGYPILASNLGALPERLATYPTAKVLPWNSSVDSWCQAMLAHEFDKVNTLDQAKPFSLTDYLDTVEREPKTDWEQSLLDFAQFAQSPSGWKIEWSLHGMKMLILKTLIWIKHQKVVAKLLRHIPNGIQLGVKNWLLGAKR